VKINEVTFNKRACLIEDYDVDFISVMVKAV
jgi:hypothetical protein